MARYVIAGETLTNIADAIREKTDTTAALFPGVMPGIIRSIQTGSGDTTGIPDDIVSEAERVATSILSKKTGNSVTFIAITDMHEYGDNDHSDASVIERGRRANKNAGQAAKLISDRVGLDFFANLGDYAYAAKNASLVTSYHDLMQSIAAVKSYTGAVVNSNTSIELPGNHDPLHVIQDESGNYITNDIVTGLIGNYKYIDITSKKVRVIGLHTAEYTDGYSSDGRMSGEQLQWFANALDLSEKADASEWSIIILSHHPLDWGGLNNAVGVLKSYIAGSSFSATHNGVAVSYDFTGKNMATVIANFHGHVHNLKVDKITGTEIKRLAIPNACYGRNNEYGTNGKTDSNGIEFGEETTYYKSDNGTGKNTAFCVVSIDLTEKNIYADCFGAGYDRIVSYGEAVVETFTITNNLTNVTNSNGAKVVVAGTPYTGNIAAIDGYELDSVTVSMGGTDITSTAYSNGTISIAEVTGNIVITATASSNVVYDVTNLVPAATVVNGTDIFGDDYNGDGVNDGYWDDTRISSAVKPEEGNGPGFVTTGVMPYAENDDGTHKTIYIRGATLDTTNSSCRWSGLPAGQTATESNCIALNGGATIVGNQFGTYFTIEERETGTYYKLTPIESAFDSWSRTIGSMMMSLKGCGADLIITVDEPIE